MSGGAMDYIGYKLNEISSMVPDMELRDLEWYLSGDTCEGDWLKSAKEFRDKWLRSDWKERLKEYVDKSTHELHGELMEIIGLSYHCFKCKEYKQKEPESDYGQCKKAKHYLIHGYSRICNEFEAVED